MLVNNDNSYLHLQKNCFIKNCHTMNYSRAYDYGTEIGICLVFRNGNVVYCTSLYVMEASVSHPHAILYSNVNFGDFVTA